MSNLTGSILADILPRVCALREMSMYLSYIAFIVSENDLADALNKITGPSK